MRDKLGFLGTFFASLCCLGVSVVIAPLTAIGLGFLINDFILLPLVLAFLLTTLWGLYTGWKRHGERRPFFLGIFTAALLIPSFFVNAYFSSLLLVLLLVATIWNTDKFLWRFPFADDIVSEDNIHITEEIPK